jgi:transcriptional regulator with XRE-family HTH domain
VADAVRQKKISLRKGAGMLGISYTTLRNWMKNQDNQKT